MNVENTQGLIESIEEGKNNIVYDIWVEWAIDLINQTIARWPNGEEKPSTFIMEQHNVKANTKRT